MFIVDFNSVAFYAYKIVFTKLLPLVSYTASCVPIIMYVLGLFAGNPNIINVYSLVALWISTFLQNFITLVFELCNLEKKKKMNKTLYHTSMMLGTMPNRTY